MPDRRFIQTTFLSQSFTKSKNHVKKSTPSQLKPECPPRFVRQTKKQMDILLPPPSRSQGELWNSMVRIHDCGVTLQRCTVRLRQNWMEALSSNEMTHIVCYYNARRLLLTTDLVTNKLYV
jgi:hypothetical protein